MANADMNRLMDNARIRLPGAVDTAILMELFTVMKEFFKGSNVWTGAIEFAVSPSASSYYDAPEDYTHTIAPAEGTVVRLTRVTAPGGSPVYATMPEPGEVVLGALPAAAGTYRAEVVLSVRDPLTSDGYPQFPDWVLDLYFDEILDGLLGRMMSQIAKPYSAPAIAAVHLRKFKQGISRARTDAKRKNMQNAQAWRFPRSFAQ